MKNTVGYELKNLDNLIQRKLIKESKKNENILITPVQIHILKYLVDNGESYQKDIDKEFKFRRSTSLGIIKTMEKNGLIIRNESKENSRLKKISISKEGLKRIKSVKEQMMEFESMLIDGIDRSELEVFFKVINKIKENIKEEI